MMRQNRRCLRERVVGREAAIRPDFQNQTVVIRAVADTRGFNRVTHARDGRKYRINRDNAYGLSRLFIFVARTKTAPDFHFQFHLEFFLFVERANDLIRIDQFDVLVGLDVGSGHFAFLVRRKQQCLRLARVRLELDLLEIQNDVGHVLNNAVNRGEFMLRAVHFERRNGRAFERREQHAAKRVADGVAVTGFKRVGDKFCVGFRGGGFFLLQPLGHFETSESDWHIFLSTILI